MKKKFFYLLMVSLVLIVIEIASLLYLKISSSGLVSGDSYLSMYQRFEKKHDPNDGSKSKENVFDFDYERAHPYFGHVLSEDSKESFGGIQHLNNHGFRSKYDFPYHKNKNEFVIGIFGGSVAHYFAQQMIETDLLAKLLKKAIPILNDKKLIVLNMAFGASKQPQQFYIYSFFSSMFDYVINIDGENEINLYPDKKYPVEFPYYSSILYNESSEMLLPVGKIALVKSFMTSFSKLLQAPVINRSSVIYTVWSFSEKMYQRYLKQLQLEIMNMHSRDYKKDQFYPNDSYKVREQLAVKAWIKYSRLQAYLLNRNKTNYSFFIQPTQYLLDSKLLSAKELKAAFSKEEVVWKRRKYQILEQKVKSMRNDGIRYFSLARIFKNNSEDIFVDPCCHINDRGNEIMAKSIVKTIKEEGF